jgi:hypothetical protein
MNTSAIAPPPGGSTTARTALTGNQIQLVIAAAHKALSASNIEIGPYKVNKIVRRFTKALVRSRLTFHEFLSDQASQRRLLLRDPELASVIAYVDPTGEKAVNHVLHQRGY